MRREVARIVVLVIASALLIATSPPQPPHGMVERSSVLPAGERRLQVHVSARLDGGFAGVTQPFSAHLQVHSASLPAADGNPAAGAVVKASVGIDGNARMFPSEEGIPAAGTCDDDGCRVGYTVVFSLAEPNERDVVVSWSLSVQGTDELIDGSSEISMAIDEDRAALAPSDSPMPYSTRAVRLDRVDRGEAIVTVLNRSDRSLRLSIGRHRRVVPANASRSIEPFDDCPRLACTVEVRFDRPLFPAALLVSGPVVVSGVGVPGDKPHLREVPTATPRITSPPVTESMRLSQKLPIEYLTVIIDVNKAAGTPSSDEQHDPRVAVRLRMRLTQASEGAVVRYPSDLNAPYLLASEIMVLSEAAAPGEPQTVTLRAPQLRQAAGSELLAGQWAHVQVTAQAMVLYPDGIPDGAEVTARLER